MKKYKICVYAISKNEEKFVDRWYESMKEADYIVVLDTGSTDNTLSKLQSKNIIVDQKEITPWRFDVARNESLKLVPIDTDICVCTDLDEVFDKGWRKKIEKIWDKDTTRIAYNYNWLLDENDKVVGVIDFCFAGTGNPNMDVARMVSRPAPAEFEKAFLSHFDNEDEIERMRDAWQHIDNGYAEHIRTHFPEINLKQL